MLVLLPSISPLKILSILRRWGRVFATFRTSWNSEMSCDWNREWNEGSKGFWLYNWDLLLSKQKGCKLRRLASVIFF